MDDLKTCPACGGFMYAIKGGVFPGLVLSPSKKKDWFCGRCKYNERS